MARNAMCCVDAKLKLKVERKVRQSYISQILFVTGGIIYAGLAEVHQVVQWMIPSCLTSSHSKEIFWVPHRFTNLRIAYSLFSPKCVRICKYINTNFNLIFSRAKVLKENARH